MTDYSGQDQRQTHMIITNTQRILTKGRIAMGGFLRQQCNATHRPVWKHCSRLSCSYWGL